MDDYKANDYDRDYRVCPIAKAALMVRDVPRRPEDIRRASMCIGSACAWYNPYFGRCGILPR